MFKKIVYACIAIGLITTIVSSVTACSEHKQLLPLNSDAIILAFGDSLTYGTGASRNRSYPAILEKLIHRKVINAGVPGEVSKKGLLRLPNLIKQHQPALIIICHGANDILGKLDISQTKHNIQQMINLAKQNEVQVVLIGVPEFSLWLSTSPIYQQLADKNQLFAENSILGEIIGSNALKADHVHPNAEGYQFLAEHIAELLRRSGAIPGK